MQCDISSSILHLVTGAAVTQVLLLVLSMNFGGIGLPSTVFAGIDGLHMVLFGVFDLIGGVGFAALMQRQVEPSLQVTE
jgi:hypothetical protein